MLADNKEQDDRKLTALQSNVLKLVPKAPETIRSREIAGKLEKEQSQISDILKKLNYRGYVISPAFGEYSLCPY